MFYFNLILGYGTDSKLNGETFKKWTEVLRRYVKNIADRELQVLFAVPCLFFVTLVTQRQHPKGFFLFFLSYLFNFMVPLCFQYYFLFLSRIDPRDI
jgi:translation initiation factor 4G